MNIPRVNPGVGAGIGAAFLFGISTPLTKPLLNAANPWLVAGLLYLSSGIALMLFRILRKSPRVKLASREIWALLGATVFGGILAPVLLLYGLSHTPASGASLLLNAEGIFTAALAWIVFRENVDRRIILGFLLILAGMFTLSWPGEAEFAGIWPLLAIIAACACWGIDNNFTGLISVHDAPFIAGIKGLVAGSVNLLLAVAILGANFPSLPALVQISTIGISSYGLSLMLFVVALRHVGTSRTGAYFSIAPFFGAALAVILGEPITTKLLVAGVLMAIGIYLHVVEKHEHEHRHPQVAHQHPHRHDDGHHDHQHPQGAIPAGTWHEHQHEHAELVHTHPHYPDSTHRHEH